MNLLEVVQQLASANIAFTCHYASTKDNPEVMAVITITESVNNAQVRLLGELNADMDAKGSFRILTKTERT
jgi:hypothetical protein